MAESRLTTRHLIRRRFEDLRLSEAARHVCVPKGVVKTGWGPVRAQCARMGVGFDVWQEGIGALALSKREDGVYAAGVGGVVLSIPRQTGKTYTIGWMVFALCTLFSGLTVIWTAHRTRTANETFESMRTMTKRSKVSPLVDRVRAVNGEQAIFFRNGSRILFGARESGFGRGFAKVDVLVLDEAQILTENAMSDMVPATNAAPNGLVLMMGTPPRPKDPGEVFAQRRADALAGDADTCYVEFSADRDARSDDWNQLAKANPSFPHRTSKTAISRMKKLLGSEDNFRREALGIWDEADVQPRAVPASLWESAAVEEAPSGGVRSLAVTFSKDGGRMAVAGAVKHVAGTHVELVGAFSGSTEAGVSALADWLAARWRSTAMIAISGRAGDVTLEAALRERKVPQSVIHVLNSRDFLTSPQLLIEALREGQVTHPKAEAGDALEDSVARVTKKPRGKDGAWSWQAMSEEDDETPIEAVAVALWAARTAKRVPGRKGKALA